MKAFATKQSSNDTFTRKGLRSHPTPIPAVKSVSIFSTGYTGIQRKSHCACGGGCPRCQSTLPIQTKLAVSQPGDVYEQEADRVAEQVMRMPAPTLQRTCDPCAAGGPLCPNCEAEKQRSIQRKTEEVSDQSDASVPENFLQNLGPGQPLDPATRVFMESRFGRDFRQVRVHTDARVSETARRVNAVAYTIGPDIVFRAGRYDPETSEGKKLLAHELTHVVQQGRGQPISSQRQTSPLAISRLDNPPGLAREMDVDEDDERVKTDEGEQPKDMDETQAAGFGAEALETVGYDELMRLAIEAGFLKTGSGDEAGSEDAERIQRQSLAPEDVIYRQAEAVTFGAVFSRYAIAAGIASQVDSPAPGPGDVVALGILAVGLVAAGIAVLSRPACPPCPPNPPPEIDRVPPSAPHWPCPGDHWHFQVYNQNPVTCQCFLSGRRFGGCCGVPGAPC